MSKICPDCQEVFDDNRSFCDCGARLVDMAEKPNPTLNLGDANAISGGVSINQSKNITSHDTHYHSTTVHERSKSESELKLDANNQLRAKAEEIMAERKRIDSLAISQLRPLALQLGIDDETFKSIIKDVRSNRNGSASGLNAANARYLQQAQQAVQTNDMDTLSNLTPRLEAMAAISQDDNVQYLYYLTLSLFYPLKSMEVYERQTDENYWRTFWAIVSYIRTGKHAEATSLLALFDPLRYEKPEDDQNLLEAYFNIMKQDKDGAQEFLDEILGETSEQVKPLLRAVESTLYEEDAESLEVRFYMERVMTKADVVVKSQKNVEPLTQKEEPLQKDTKPEVNQKTQPTPSETLPINNVEGTDKNKVFGEEWIRKAADAGVEEAIDFLKDTIDKPLEKDNLETELQMAKKAYDDQDYETAISIWKELAERNNPEAIRKIGLCYSRGQGVALDYTESIKWYKKAIELGDAQAMTNLGNCYNLGQGVTQNQKEAFKWHKKAAELGNANGICSLGWSYECGHGITKNHKEAVKYLKKAAKMDNVRAMRLLGKSMINESNYKEASKWYKKAAELGDVESMVGLAKLLFDMCEVTEAAKWGQKALDNGYVDNNGEIDNIIDFASAPIPEAIFEKAWLTQLDEQTIVVHFDLRLTNLKGESVSVICVTKSLSPLSTFDKNTNVIFVSNSKPVKLEFEDTRLDDWKYFLHESDISNKLSYSNHSFELETEISVFDNNKICLGSYSIKYNVIHEGRIIKSNRLLLVNKK